MMEFLQLCTVMPGDGGPIYGETDLSRFPVEPWNTASLLPFLLLTLYWAWKLRREWRAHKLLSASIPLLLIGFFGGLLYHARRDNPLWLQLDYIPIALLAAMAACEFWKSLWNGHRRSFYASALSSIAIVLLLILAPLNLSRQEAISVSYAQLALLVLLPAFVLSASRSWTGLFPLCWALCAFSLALSFRVLDFEQLSAMALPTGTHWLWHIFGAAAAGGIMSFVYRLQTEDKPEVEPGTD